MNKIETVFTKKEKKKNPTEGRLGQEADVTVGFQNEWEQRKKDHLHLQVISEQQKSML